jgi:2-dehydropantoate 2-reductase
MKIVIIGAGAMGCLYGAGLSEAGNEVWLIDIWQKHIEEIKQNGLIVENSSGQRIYRNLKASVDPAEAGAADIAIIFVKSTLTEEALIRNGCMITDSTIVITLQNGLGNIEKIEKTADKRNIIAGTTAHGAMLLGPGKIRHAGTGKTVIGELDGSDSDRINSIAEILRASGFETEISLNVVGLIWDKLLVNVGINALTAITGMTNGELLDYPEIVEILEAAVHEAFLIANLKGIKTSFTDPVEHTKEVCRLTTANKSSMLQDILNERNTEIETINGAIVKEGKALGVETPVNMVLSNLVRWKQGFFHTTSNP